jgi:limonene-1,2-epoxide hydrolase
MNYSHLHQTFGRDAQDCTAGATDAGMAGALAALESFYFAFNHGDLEVFQQVWVPSDKIRLNNPLGGILEGIDPITALYDGIFNGPAEVWVEFHDIVAYDFGDSVVFAGRERGEFAKGDLSVPLDIRTSRVLHRANGRWGQVHHHGSITDTSQLDSYRAAVNS